VGFSRKKDSSNYLIVAVALILAGAFGNIIDSVLRCNFDDSHSQLATLFSEQPYGAYFQKWYMFYLERKPPNWLPIWGGNDFTFNAIFT
jgi:signal peptidase II